MIDPGTNPAGEDFEAYNRRRWGGSGWTRDLRAKGRKDGAGANFDNWKWWPNTYKAHQLVRFAESKGIDTSTSNRVLFEAIYEEGENISLVDTLVRIAAEKMSLPADEVRSYLESDAGGAEIQNDIKSGRRKYSISGVPFFIIGAEGNGQLPYAMSGAQSSSTFLRTFETVLEEAEE